MSVILPNDTARRFFRNSWLMDAELATALLKPTSKPNKRCC